VTEPGDEVGMALPASIEAAWGRPTKPARGPKPALSLERIVEAAVAVADAEGLSAVSMARVAAELSMSPMSLYRYVAAKDELLLLMVDASYGVAPIGGVAAGRPWRDGLAAWARQQHLAERAHPWVVQVPVRGMPTTPNLVAMLDDGLTGLRPTGLTVQERFSVLLLVTSYVRAESLLGGQVDEAFAALGGTAGDAMAAYGRTLAALIDRDERPGMAEAIDAGFFDTPDGDPDDEFEFGLERILDGVEVLVKARRRRPSPPA
jgi:AcrR family transcriptional regulator